MGEVILPQGLATFGWREWVALNDLNLPTIKAKIDTGARTSALHAFELEPILENGVERIKFKIHASHKNNDAVTECVANIVDQRDIKNSGGQLETRWVIESNLTVGTLTWPIELTLTSRKDMKFRMLIGRSAMKNRIVVDPSRSYLVGKKRRSLKKLEM